MTPFWAEDVPPSPETYVALRAACGLGPRSLSAARIGLAGGLFCVTASERGALIAMGRLVGDGGCFTQLVDVMVRQDRHGRGLGAEVVDRCLAWGRAHLPESCLIGLHAAPGAEPFYAARGFRPLTGMVTNV